MVSEPPREARILEDECIISNTSAMIVIKYDETVRINELVLSYKEALYKGLSVKQWEHTTVSEFSRGRATVCLRALQCATMYRMSVKAVNDFGAGPASHEVWFRTVDGDVEIRKT